MQTANLLKDIREERFHKIDMGLRALEGPITVKLNNVSAMECNMIRHFFQGALDQFHRLAKVCLSLHGMIGLTTLLYSSSHPHPTLKLYIPLLLTGVMLAQVTMVFVSCQLCVSSSVMSLLPA